MFNQKEIEAYRSVSAPVDLRDKILSSGADMAPKKRTPREYMRRASSIAACFVLVAVLTVFAAGSFGNVSVSLSGSELYEDKSMTYVSNGGAQSISVHRERTETTIPLAFDGHAELSVSNGVMKIVSEETQEVLYTGTDYSIDGKTLVHWVVYADDTAQTFEMTVRGTFKTEKIILTYHVSENEWTVTRTDAE